MVGVISRPLMPSNMGFRMPTALSLAPYALWSGKGNLWVRFFPNQTVLPCPALIGLCYYKFGLPRFVMEYSRNIDELWPELLQCAGGLHKNCIKIIQFRIIIIRILQASMQHVLLIQHMQCFIMKASRVISLPEIVCISHHEAWCVGNFVSFICLDLLKQLVIFPYVFLGSCFFLVCVCMCCIDLVGFLNPTKFFQNIQ